MSNWRDVETVECPDLPAAKEHLKAARQPLTDALKKWRGQQDRIDRSHVSSNPAPRAEYRLKMSKDGLTAVVQFRELG